MSKNDWIGRELERAKLHGPDVRTIDALEGALALLPRTSKAAILAENWHAIEGPNGQCACGPANGRCGDRLAAFIAALEADSRTKSGNDSQCPTTGIRPSDLNRRVEVEQRLLDAFTGKQPIPDKNECRALAFKLGIPKEGQ